MRSTMRRSHTFEPLAYGVYHRFDQLVEFIRYPSKLYIRKYIAYGESMIKLILGSQGLLIEPQIVQQAFILQGRYRIRQTNLVSIYLFDRKWNHREVILQAH